MSSSFPYVRHASLLTTHSIVLAFSALFLPRSTPLIAPLPPQQSSLDKPQHPFLVPLTASPVWTLIWLCAGAGACQAWWAGWIRHWSRDPSVVARSTDRKLQALRNAWANTLVASLLSHAAIVLFGAPIITHVPHTFLLALLISVLTVFVPSYALSLPFLPTDLLWLGRTSSPLDRVLVYPVRGALVGAWTGVFPIPLDWDRPWQAWPLTPAYGALAGHIAGAWFAVATNAVFFLASEGRQMHDQPKERVNQVKRKGE